VARWFAGRVPRDRDAVDEGASVWVTSKAATGFTINLDNGGTISVGTVDVTVVSA
jgi:hypothetical protein